MAHRKSSGKIAQLEQVKMESLILSMAAKMSMSRGRREGFAVGEGRSLARQRDDGVSDRVQEHRVETMWHQT